VTAGLRRPYLVIPTPLPGLPEAVLFYDTWFDKITRYHPELLGMESAIRLVISTPNSVCTGTSNPAYRVFLNDLVRSPGGSAPLTVYVDPVPRVIVSAYYNRSFANRTASTVIWQPSQNSLPRN